MPTREYKNRSDELFHRWEWVLRCKAREYEHAARKRGENVTSPTLDDLANELKAYAAAIETCTQE